MRAAVRPLFILVFAIAAHGVAGSMAVARADAGGSYLQCYIPQKPEGPVALRATPSAKGKVVTMMPAGSRVSNVPKVKERGEWIYVTWFWDDPARKNERARGWVNRAEIHGGECAD